MFDLFLLSGSKLYSTFPKNLAKINGIKIFRNDRNRFGEGLILYVNEQVSCKLFSGNPKLSDLENLILELYRNNRKWLFLVAYKSPNQNDSQFLKKIGIIYITL